MALSPKQLLSIQEATHRYNIWSGAVSSGKTFASTFCFAQLLKHGPPGDVMILGVSRETIQRNVLGELYGLLGFPAPPSKSSEDTLFGRRVYFVGVPDESSVRRVQGATLALAYVDEAEHCPEKVWKMLQSRLRVPGAQLLATCNPEGGPKHWLKKDFIDRSNEIDLICWNFFLEDNPWLTEKYKTDLKKEYTGVWHQRYIQGLWVAAQGLIYDSFDDDNIYINPFPTPSYYVCGIDYGTSNATAAVLCAVTPRQYPQIKVEAEYYYDSIVKGRSKTDAELADDIYEFVRYKNVSAIYVDPSAASLKLELRRKDLPVLDAKNDILPGIKVTAKFISGKNIVIQKGCTVLLDCIQSYVWDHKAADRGEDMPLKKREHILDALRYAIFTAFPTGEFNNPDDNLTNDQLRRQVYGDEGYGFINPGMGGGYF